MSEEYKVHDVEEIADRFMQDVEQAFADAARWRHVRDLLAFSWVDNHGTFGWSFRSIQGKGVLDKVMDRLIESAKREER